MNPQSPQQSAAALAAPLSNTPVDGVQVLGPETEESSEILTREALAFVAKLQRKFGPIRRQLLSERQETQRQIDAGRMPDFLPETEGIRNADWRIAPVPADLQDRRVEITGPVDRKMVINALNSGAKVFMADFEDSHSPTWQATIDGQVNLRDAVAGTIEYTNPAGKHYALGNETATLMVRPRGWHLVEKHVLVDGEPVSASLFDFGLFFFHNAQALITKGTGPYFYLPKLQHYREARLWNRVFELAQDELGIARGTIKATVLIETLPAAFQMDEILHELREHSAGLNCGRWDYIFSFIKTFHNHADFVLPDRVQITMTVPFMRSYSLLSIKTCHRRGAHAMGGMAAQIPIKNDPEANAEALAKVAADKRREAEDGHDGTWVAHPGLVPLAREIFDAIMPGPNQLERLREDVEVTAADLRQPSTGPITEAGLRTNINVGLRYMESWLRGAGCVPIFNLMEDAATAEISRTQIWQWIRHPGVVLDDVHDGDRQVTSELFRQVLAEELERIRTDVGPEVFAASRYDLASRLFEEIVCRDELTEFLTLDAYEYLD